jgi:hypothetical protein
MIHVSFPGYTGIDRGVVVYILALRGGKSLPGYLSKPWRTKLP